MLEFFRTYQRYFFVFVTIVIVTSFVFFGTFSVLEPEQKREDRRVGYAVDGSSLMLSEVRALSRFIASDQDDVFIRHRKEIPNLCNDGVVRNDFLQSGLADLLVAAYFEPLKADLASRYERVKRFVPYAHPSLPFINVEAVWDRLVPAMRSELLAVKQESEISSASFSKLSRLYQHQSHFNPEALRRILLMQHRQISGQEADLALQSADLSLFGFHSLVDWFGHQFLDVVAEFILNAAAAAEKNGYQVTLEEAKGDLLRNFQLAMKKLSESQAAPSLSWQQHLHSLGFDEKNAASTWRKVLLFRRYFQGISQASFVDRLPCREFGAYTNETAVIHLYQWPAALRLKTLQDLIEFQTYLSLVAPPTKDPLALPATYFSLEEVKANCPDLVHTTFRAQVSEISLLEVALRAPVQAVWDWQLDEANWQTLINEFAFLPCRSSRKERFETLEKLSSDQRAKVDTFSRLRLLDCHPEWIDEALTSTQAEEKILFLSSNRSSLPRIKQPRHLESLLFLAVKGDEEASKTLLRYQDHHGTSLYCIKEVELVEIEHILTFCEARRLSLLAEISDQWLQKEYLKIRGKSSDKFQSSQGGWKPFFEVKDEIARSVFFNVFEPLENLAKAQSKEDQLFSCRMLAPTQAAFLELQKNPETSQWIQTTKGGLQDQFKLERTEQHIQRTHKEKWMREKVFQMYPHEWSLVQVLPNGEISFFYLLDKRPGEAPILDSISFGKELIVADAQLYLAGKLLEEIVEKKSIMIPLQGEE